jgi:hypothetical protein
MTGSPPSGPAPPHALRAGDHKRPPDPPNPGRKDPRLTHLPSPPSTPCAERRRRGQGPSAAHAVGPRGPIPDPDAATGVAQKRRRTTEKRSTIRVSPSLTSPVPFRDDGAAETAPPAAQRAPRRSEIKVGQRHPAVLWGVARGLPCKQVLKGSTWSKLPTKAATKPFDLWPLVTGEGVRMSQPCPSPIRVVP